MPRLNVPVIGIGAGAATDGQVLVFHDLLGIYDGHVPKFVKRYAEIGTEMAVAVAQYASEVRARRFPAKEHTYSVEEDQLAEFKRYLDQETLASADWDWSATEI
jgi:3-methyl-2-oxobutanoate hydroxymethyltransferase